MIYPKGFKTIVREYKGWTYHAAEIVNNGMRIIYGRFKGNDGKIHETLETYSGPNYIPGSIGKSYSRKYEIDNIPKAHSNTRFLLEQFLIQEMGNKLLQI